MVQNNKGTATQTQPIDRSNEALIDPETSFDELLRILMSKPEMESAKNLEREVQKREGVEARLRAEFGKDYGAVVEGVPKGQSLKKAKRRPGAIQLRAEVSRIAVKQIGDDGLCEVFVNGYAVYDNGDRKTVLWVPDCGSATYHFTKLRDNEKQYQVEKDTVGQDVFGPAPWYIAVTVAGENNIERTLDHPKSAGTMSDTGVEEDYEVKPAHRWIGGAHFDNPEEAYIKKEEHEERLNRFRGRVQEVCDLLSQGYNQREIGEILGVDRRTVTTYVGRARRQMERENENNS